MTVINTFYKFGSKFKISYFHAYLIELDCEEKIAQGEYQGINFPLIFKQAGGKKIHDIIDGGFAGLYLISDRMKLILEENKLTGWKTFPIKLLDKQSNEIVGYHGLSIIGRCGSLSYKNSEIIETRFVSNGPICKFYKGVSVDNWDGNDFFSPQQTLHIFITERAANILKKNEISNLELKSTRDYERSVNDVKLFEKRNQ